MCWFYCLFMDGIDAPHRILHSLFCLSLWGYMVTLNFDEFSNYLMSLDIHELRQLEEHIMLCDWISFRLLDITRYQWICDYKISLDIQSTFYGISRYHVERSNDGDYATTMQVTKCATWTTLYSAMMESFSDTAGNTTVSYASKFDDELSVWI